MGSFCTKLGVAQVDGHGQARPLWAKVVDPAGVLVKAAPMLTSEQEMSLRYSPPTDTDADDTPEDGLESTPEPGASVEDPDKTAHE